jgi:hypothetical protein
VHRYASARTLILLGFSQFAKKDMNRRMNRLSISDASPHSLQQPQPSLVLLGHPVPALSDSDCNGAAAVLHAPVTEPSRRGVSRAQTERLGSRLRCANYSGVSTTSSGAMLTCEGYTHPAGQVRASWIHRVANSLLTLAKSPSPRIPRIDAPRIARKGKPPTTRIRESRQIEPRRAHAHPLRIPVSRRLRVR